jgi:uncharacterized membrane protein
MFNSTLSSDESSSSSKYGPGRLETTVSSIVSMDSSGGVTCAVQATSNAAVRAKVKVEKVFMEETMENACGGLKARVASYVMQRKTYADLLLTAGLAFVFAYFGIDKFVHPQWWIDWMPTWMEGLLGLSRNGWMYITGALEILFAAMLIIPVRPIRQAGALLTALHLVAVLTQTGWNDIAIRDIGLLFMSLGLFALM